MADPATIRINALLLEREGHFLRVHELEQAAAAILGEPYPFSQPPLPSNQRTKGKSTKRSKATDATPKIRKLTDDESAYRVTYRQQGQTRTEDHASTEALHTLLAAQSRTLDVLHIATLAPDGSELVTLHGTAPTES